MPVSYQYHYLQKSAFFCCVHVIVAGIETLFLLLTEGILLLTEGKFFLRVLSQVHKKLGGGVVYCKLVLIVHTCVRCVGYLLYLPYTQAVEI
jgi:hypothetical protein